MSPQFTTAICSDHELPNQERAQPTPSRRTCAYSRVDFPMGLSGKFLSSLPATFLSTPTLASPAGLDILDVLDSNDSTGSRFTADGKACKADISGFTAGAVGCKDKGACTALALHARPSLPMGNNGSVDFAHTSSGKALANMLSSEASVSVMACGLTLLVLLNSSHPYLSRRGRQERQDPTHSNAL